MIDPARIASIRAAAREVGEEVLNWPLAYAAADLAALASMAKWLNSQGISVVKMRDVWWRSDDREPSTWVRLDATTYEDATLAAVEARIAQLKKEKA